MKIYRKQLDIRPEAQKTPTLKGLLLLFILIFQFGCAKDSSFQGAWELPSEDDSGLGTEPAPPDETAPPPDFNYEKLAWEDGGSEKEQWSFAAIEIVTNSSLSLKLGAKDVTDFCPQYARKTDVEKINFWAYLVSVIAKYETGFSKTKRVIHESGGTDPVTQLPAYREGLLNVSYADTINYKGCQFDWNKDRNLLPNSSAKTIYDPIKNIRCGISILDAQIASTGKIATDKGAYWLSLNPKAKAKKIKEISTLTKSLQACK